MPRLTRLTHVTASARSARLRSRSGATDDAQAPAPSTSQLPAAEPASESASSSAVSNTLESALDLCSPEPEPPAVDHGDDPGAARRNRLAQSAASAVRASGAAYERRRRQQASAAGPSASSSVPRIKPDPEVSEAAAETEPMAGSPDEAAAPPLFRGETQEPGVAGERPSTPPRVKAEPLLEDPISQDAAQTSMPPPRTPPARRRRGGTRALSSRAPTDDASLPPEPRGASETAPPEEEPEKEIRVRDFEWPPHYIELEKTFKALNTVYAFCSSRKHLATTYDTLRASVEGLLKRPLEIFDLAQLKSLCPDLISLGYVDMEALSLHLEGPVPTGREFGRSRAADRQAVDEIYAATARDIAADQAAALEETLDEEQALAEGATSAKNGKRKEREDFVLLFEFNDGTLLGGPKATQRGRFGMRRGPAQGPPRQMAKEDPAKTARGMRKLIEKRHFKFEQAVLELLCACLAKNEDPVQLLISAAHGHVPVDPTHSAGDQTLGDTPRKRRLRLEHLMAHPEERSSITDVIEELKGTKWWRDQIVPGGQRTIPAREAVHEGLTFALSQSIVNALWATRQIEEFYLHQADALNALEEGHNVIVSTSTSSGKSLIYQIPVLRALEEDPSSTAMYIFPTKALAQDQRRTLQDLLFQCEGLEETIVATYDGDTDKSLRADVRERASVIFTNPDMLHQSILPAESLWRRFLRSLRFVVVDELHCYNGLFGAHVSFIMRRLRRICAALGNRRVRFVSCSATVANPREHMQTLFGIDDVEVITQDGSPAGAKEWLIWNPPLIDPDDPAQGRISTYAEVSQLFRHLVQRGVRTIVFCKVRRTCEIVMNQIRSDLLLDDRSDVAQRVMSYRSGYSPQDRRKIETDMFKGSLLGIVATSALELGIDIGSLDAVIMVGFPYSVSSLRQQAGRAGRRQKDSLAVLVGDPFPLDQHYMRNPEEVFSQPDAALSVDLMNDFVREGHLQCAAAEIPVHPEEDAPYFGADLGVLCKTRLESDGAGFYTARSELLPFPAKEVAIRGARQETYIYVDDSPGRRNGPRVMEEVETDRAIFEAFEGAVFMHQGRSFLCKEISHDTRIARMVQSDVNYHTRPRDHTDTDAVETHRIRALRGSSSRAYYGHVRIETRVWGYFKVDRRANILDSVSVDCPPFVRDTKGLWLDVPLWIIDAMTAKTINAAAAIHAAEHALLSLTPMFVVSLAGDVRTECKVAEREYARKATTRKRPARLIFYDTPGQNGGVCAKAFEHLDGLIRIAVAVIEGCQCVEGCPSCVTSQTCAHANVVTSKVGALGVLRGLIGLQPFDVDLPQQNEPGHAEGNLASAHAVGHTICEAVPVRAASDVQVELVDEHLPPSMLNSLQRLKQEAQDSHRSDPSERPTPGRSRIYEESVPLP